MGCYGPIRYISWTATGSKMDSLSIAVFSFLYLKKIKISKIYVGFGKFQKYTRSPYWGATWLKCNFFFFKFATKSLEKKKEGGLSPPQRATGSCVLNPGQQSLFKPKFVKSQHNSNIKPHCIPNVWRWV